MDDDGGVRGVAGTHFEMYWLQRDEHVTLHIGTFLHRNTFYSKR